MTDTVKALSRLLREVLTGASIRASRLSWRFSPTAASWNSHSRFRSHAAPRAARRSRIAWRGTHARSRSATSPNAKVHETGDPEVFIVEFTGFGRAVATGARFEQRYVSVIRLRAGRIVHYVNYWNPIAILRTLWGQDFVESLAD